MMIQRVLELMAISPPGAHCPDLLLPQPELLSLFAHLFLAHQGQMHPHGTDREHHEEENSQDHRLGKRFAVNPSALTAWLSKSPAET
jgi:hypothetical protein